MISGKISKADELQKAKLELDEFRACLISFPELTDGMDKKEVKYAYDELPKCNGNNPLPEDDHEKIQKMHDEMMNVIENLPRLNVDLRQAKKDVIKLITFEAYAESSPQAILQTYTLWKRPSQCFSYTNGRITILQSTYLLNRKKLSYNFHLSTTSY